MSTRKKTPLSILLAIQNSSRLKAAIAIVLLIILIILPNIIDNSFITGIMIKCALYTMLAMAVNLVQGYCGMSFLGCAGLICVGAYTGALLMTRLSVNFFVAMIFSGMASMVFGFILSRLTVRLSGGYLGIVTVGFSEIVRIIAQNWTSLTGGPMGIKNIPVPSISNFTFSGVRYFYLALTLSVLCLFCSIRVINSHTGRVWQSIKADQSATQALGVNILSYRTLCFVYAVFWTGVGGCFMAAYYRYISADMFSMQESFNVLSMVIIGGMGTTFGPAIGAALITILNEVFEFAGELRQVGYGMVVIIMLWWQPHGIMGIVHKIGQKLKHLEHSLENGGVSNGAVGS